MLQLDEVLSSSQPLRRSNEDLWIATLSRRHRMPLSRRPAYEVVDGLRVCAVYDPSCVRSALNFIPESGDIFLVTYPKCGTHWTQQIVQLILNEGESAKDLFQFQQRTPYIELVGTEMLKDMPKPRVIRTHLPYDLKPHHDEAKYIYVARNPWDCCVSFYHHTRSFAGYQFKDGTFDDFLQLFINGETDYGDYFDHLLSWYPHRNDSNVMFFTYEDLKDDTRGMVWKIARFLGDQYEVTIAKNEQVLQNVLDKSSLEYMKSLTEFDAATVREIMKSNPQAVPKAIQRVAMSAKDGEFGKMTIVRKGIVGDWKTHFTPQQSDQMRDWIQRKTQGSDVMTLWKRLTF